MAVDTRTLNPDIAWAVEDVRRRAPAYKLALDYHEGRHRMFVQVGKFNRAVAEALRELCDNVCDDVVDEPVDRMQIDGWRSAGLPRLTDRRRPAPTQTVDQEGQPVEPAPDWGAPSDTLGQQAKEWWTKARGASTMGAVFTDGYRGGDGFTIVWEDEEGFPRAYQQSPDMIAVAYSPTMPDKIVKAGKVWLEGKRWRLTLYYPDHLEHWAARTGTDGALPTWLGFRPYADDTTEHWVPNHTRRVPVFHYPMGFPGKYGRSVLADVISLQDLLNLTMVSSAVNTERYVLPQRWATGLQLFQTANALSATPGTDIPFRPGDDLWWTGKEGAAFGQFPLSDPAMLTAREDAIRSEIGRKGAIPPSRVSREGAQAPTGISMLMEEGRTIKRVKDRIRDWDVTLREQVAYALSWDAPDSITADDLETVWGPVETRDEAGLLANLLTKRDLGVPDDVLLVEAGYPEEQAIAWVQEREAKAAQTQAQMGMGLGGRTSLPDGQDAVKAVQALGLPGAPASPEGGNRSALEG